MSETESIIMDFIEQTIVQLGNLSKMDVNNINLVCDKLTARQGHCFTTGVGKSQYVALKLSASLSSIGINSNFINPVDAVHGDLGKISSADVIIAFSHSGQTAELVPFLQCANAIGATVVVVTANEASMLSNMATVIVAYPPITNVGVSGLPPTTSLVASLIVADAILVACEHKYGVTSETFHGYHPAGAIGSYLSLRMHQIMRTSSNCPVCFIDDLLPNVVTSMKKHSLGLAAVISSKGELLGAFSDGDLRRIIATSASIESLTVVELMNKSPVTVCGGTLVHDFVRSVKEKGDKLVDVFVVDECNVLLGIVTIKDILKVTNG